MNRSELEKLGNVPWQPALIGWLVTLLFLALSLFIIFARLVYVEKTTGKTTYSVSSFGAEILNTEEFIETYTFSSVSDEIMQFVNKDGALLKIYGGLSFKTDLDTVCAVVSQQHTLNTNPLLMPKVNAQICMFGPVKAKEDADCNNISLRLWEKTSLFRLFSETGDFK